MKDQPVNEIVYSKARASRPMSAFKQACLYGASLVLMKGVALFMLPFIAHGLSTVELGRLELISSLAIFCSIMVGMGLEDTLFRFASNPASGSARCHGAAIFCLSLLLGLLVAITGLLLTPFVIQALPVNLSPFEWQLVVATIALESAIAVPLGWLRMTDQAGRFFIVTSARALLQSGLILLFIWLGFGIAGILLAGAMSCFLQCLVLATWQLKQTGIHFDLSIFKRTLSYSWPIVGSGLLAFALNGFDRWLLADVADLNQVAYYAIAAKFAVATALLMQPFGMWWSAKRFQVLASPNGQYQCANTIALGICILTFQTALLSVAAPYLITWLLPGQYSAAIALCLALIIMMYCKELVELVNIGCFSQEKTQGQLAINIAATVVGVGFMVTAAPHFMVWGIIAGLLFAQLLRLGLFYYVSQHNHYIPYPVRKIACFAACLLGLSVYHAWLWFSSFHISAGWLWVNSAIVSLIMLSSVFIANQSFQWWHWRPLLQGPMKLGLRMKHG